MRNEKFLVLGALAVGLLLWSRSAQARAFDVSTSELQTLDLGNGTYALPETFKGNVEPDTFTPVPDSVEAVAIQSQSDAVSLGFEAEFWGLQTIPVQQPSTSTAYTPWESDFPGDGESPGAAVSPPWESDWPTSNAAGSSVSVDQLIAAVADYIKQKEGLRLFVYDDATGKPWTESQRGNPTIGYGHLLSSTESRDWVLDNEADAYALLIHDVQKHLLPIISAVHVPLTVSQWIAIADLSFNIGVTGVLKSSFLRDINAGDFATAEFDYKAWNKVTLTVDGEKKQVVSAGLVNRRAAGWDMFATVDNPVMLA